ncbi:MAG: ribbon-helix-helix protein, CopG family [Terriglobia bacterium]
MGNKSASLTVRLEPSLKARLEKLAEEERRSVSDYVALELERAVEEAAKRKKQTKA